MRWVETGPLHSPHSLTCASNKAVKVFASTQLVECYEALSSISFRPIL